jgi:hypothetical protein
MDLALNIKELNKEEFGVLILNIFYYLGYSIDISNSTNFEYYLEKEELQFILKITFKNNGELNTLEDILEFRNDVMNTKSWKGYFITNTDFEKLVYEQSENSGSYVRLFNQNEVERLALKIIMN